MGDDRVVVIRRSRVVKVELQPESFAIVTMFGDFLQGYTNSSLVNNDLIQREFPWQ